MNRVRNFLSTWVGSVPPKIKLAAKLAISTIALTAVASIVDWSKVAGEGWRLLVPIAGGVLLGLALVVFLAARWRLLVQIHATRMFPLLAAARGYLLGTFCNIVAPGAVGGDIVRAHYATAHAGIGYWRSGMIVVTERLFGLLSTCLYASIGVVLNDRLGEITSLPFAQVVMILAAVTAMIVLVGSMIGRYIRIPSRLYPVLLALSFVAQSGDFLIVYSYAQLLGVNIPVADLLVVISLVYVVSVLPISPGGHGVREGALTALLVLTGVPAAQAALIALMLFLTKIALAVTGLGVFLSNRGQILDEPAKGAV